MKQAATRLAMVLVFRGQPFCTQKRQMAHENFVWT
jgi:hypothetical protein